VLILGEKIQESKSKGKAKIMQSKTITKRDFVLQRYAVIERKRQIVKMRTKSNFG
jgi:hypothetical protein